MTPWRGVDAETWTARFARAVLDPAEVRRSSFPIAGHVGAVPIRYGPSLSRRRRERTDVRGAA